MSENLFFFNLLSSATRSHNIHFSKASDKSHDPTVNWYLLIQMQSSLIFLRHPRLIRIFWFLPREKKKSKRLVEFRIVCINAIFWYDSNTYVKGLTSIIKQWKMWQLYKPCNIKRHGNSKHFTVHSDHNQCTFCTFVVSILKGIWVEDFRRIFQK